MWPSPIFLNVIPKNPAIPRTPSAAEKRRNYKTATPARPRQPRQSERSFGGTEQQNVVSFRGITCPVVGDPKLANIGSSRCSFDFY